jgi:hypothetical protein
MLQKTWLITCEKDVNLAVQWYRAVNNLYAYRKSATILTCTESNRIEGVSTDYVLLHH